MDQDTEKKQASYKIVFLGVLFLVLAIAIVAYCISQGVFTFEPKKLLTSNVNSLVQIGFESEAPNINVTPDLSIAKTASPQHTETPEPQEIKIFIVCGPGGKIDPPKSFIVMEGESVVFTIEPDKGNIVKELIIDDKNYGRVLKFKIENIREEHTVEVYFEIKPKPTPSPSPSPSPTPSPSLSPKPTSPPGEDEGPEGSGSALEDFINIITNG